MWPFKKKEEKQEITPERRYEVVQEMNRIMESGDEPRFTKFLIDHFEELPDSDRKVAIMTLYEVLKESIGQAFGAR